MSTPEKNNTVTFTNLTADQAKQLASWYEGQGEQDAIVWFEEWCEDKTPMVDDIKVEADGNVTVICN